MTTSNIELYEALKKDISEQAARMIAEAVPRASELATKAFVQEVLEQRFAEHRRQEGGRFDALEQRFAEHRRYEDQRFDALEQRFDRAFRWALAMVTPIWAGGIAAIVRVVFFG